MASFSLGIDLHKQFCYWTLINDERSILWQGKVPTTVEGTEKAFASLPVAANECRAAIEPVAQWGWYAELLESHGVSVVLANPSEVGLIAKNRLKHDKIDSKILAELLQTGYLPESYLAPRETRDLRELVRTHLSLVRIQTQVKNRVHSVLHKHGLQHSTSDLFGKRGMKWLAEQTLRPVYRIETDAFVRVLSNVQEELKSIDTAIMARAKHDADTVILETIPGIGYLTALLIKAEVGCFERFPSPGHLASYAGLVSSSHSSGGKIRLGPITKAGSRALRWAMIETAQRVNPSWGVLWKFYEKIKLKKGNKTARVALARKLLVIAWYLVKKKEGYRTRTFRELRRREAVTS
jgi:transposase